VNETEKAVHLYDLAGEWSTTQDALRRHIARKHGPDAENPIHVRNGRIWASEIPALEKTYLPPKG